MTKAYKFIAFIIVAVLFASCENESLQQYLVDSQDKKGFITLDVSASFLQVVDNAPAEVKETLNSIRKINLAGLPIRKADKNAYELEKNTLKSILGKSEYKLLMDMKDKGNKMAVYYTGNLDAIDEIVAFGYGDTMGVGVARLLGKDMNPNKIMNLMKYVNVDENDASLGAFKAIIKNN